jgi:hypothetical protein
MWTDSSKFTYSHSAATYRELEAGKIGAKLFRRKVDLLRAESKENAKPNHQNSLFGQCPYLFLALNLRNPSLFLTNLGLTVNYKC